MGKLEDEIRGLISDRGMKLAEFARKVGVPEHTLYSALRNGLASSTLPTVVPIAEELGIDPVEIYRGRLVKKTDSVHSVPVSFFDGASTDSKAADDAFPIPAKLHDRYPSSFMLRIEDESMNRVLPKGSYALIDPCEDVESSGDVYALSVDGGTTTVKRVRLLGNGLKLEPDSDDPTYHSIILDHADADAPDVHVIGRVVWYCLSLE